MMDPQPAQRFTPHGSDALEKHLAGVCDDVLAGVRSVVPEKKLEALVLGGGYGRGQGGVFKTESGDRPYNDLEFYVFVHGPRLWNERRYRAALHDLGHRLSPAAGLEVEFKVDSLGRFRRGPVTMFSYDLVSAHRLIEGKPDVFAGCDDHRDEKRIPLHEATRLLLNRCTGLLLAKELLAGPRLTPEHDDFIGRNLAKARLALGDAVLAAFGDYHWDCLERRRRLGVLAQKLPWFTDVLYHHAIGVEFKLHPRRFLKSAPDFQKELRDISECAREVWLWLEGRRLNVRHTSAHEYALSGRGKCAEVSRVRNLFLNLRTFGPRGVFDRMAGRYPRERLLNSLPLLLWEEPLNDLKVKRHLQNQLRTAASDWHSFVAAYKALWPSFR